MTLIHKGNHKKVKEYIMIIAAALMTGCSGESSSDYSSYSFDSAIENSYYQETEISDGSIVSDPERDDESFVKIEADVILYSDKQLSFSYEGNEYTLYCSPSNLMHDITSNQYRSTLAEQILQNKYGKDLKAKLTVSKDMTKIKRCDIITPNGKKYEGTAYVEFAQDPQCTIEIKGKSYIADMNDLPQWEKQNFDKTSRISSVSGFIFNDGTFMLYDLLTKSRTEGGQEFFFLDELDFQGFTAFFGTVSNMKNDKAEILLNDGKTKCNVPTYFTDGSLENGSNVMFLINCGSDLYGSGENKSFDYALIYTDPAYMKASVTSLMS